MRQQYVVGDYSYHTTKEMIEMINNNCDVDNEPRIPMMFGLNDMGWYIECLYEKDEPRLEKHLRFILGLD